MSDSTATRANVYDARPKTEVPAESPLAWSYHTSGRPSVSEKSRVILRERAMAGHLILRGGAIVLDEAVRGVLGFGLPARPNTLSLSDDGERSIQWLSPDEWLVIVPGGEEFTLERQLREALGNAHYAIVNVSGGQTLLELEGDKARELLMKSTPYDVHPDAFPVGKGVTTVFAKANLILRRPTETRWELVLRRSFADYCYRWLLDAGAEYAIGVEK
ncbi:sarcosine oxidase subunit gamma family protein [Halomonas sp. MCCC 1A17488]|uniref:Sarcosine oxidase subunit gamma family protein n=1 Tax=Billgrantia sulfidoxydans TaxID=2733484 RepID=A0ABX7VYI6_9GAMM|nr:MULTISPECIES: sarcosine oxidase subunit gamma family protein [Halomonas]MCE8016968.1 sarcosine oxidase subunit gamma family protein [Halomonas sp. MCCC 1A17488]MCG3240301.1 sarcosine oxidase subunit gamma family protein [Halomonas sp. MCCC 1A17488]QPP49827.1 sarcosine oxidase subunit gamma family protein [Halomonas sp. SS10-MC5]QTP53436.1 sarcosine oxidase subunit gamma family protein [Halomonas sulfidoxydans]